MISECEDTEVVCSVGFFTWEEILLPRGRYIQLAQSKTPYHILVSHVAHSAEMNLSIEIIFLCINAYHAVFVFARDSHSK